MPPPTPDTGKLLARASKPAEDALRLHPFYRGKLQVLPKCAIRGLEDFAVWYSPGVAAPCRAFGGINLEDIAQPKCFRVLDALRRQMSIPVWHDDQQGTATALLAGLLNALKVVGKIRIVMVGMGAANVAGYRLLTSSGVEPGAIVACDRKGILRRGRYDIEADQERFPDKRRVCRESNVDGLVGGIAEALRGADVCAAVSASGLGIIKPEWVSGMARNAIVFACANPIPEIWPWEAKARRRARGRDRPG